MVALYDICIEYIIRLPSIDTLRHHPTFVKESQVFERSTSNIIVLCSPISITLLTFLDGQSTIHEKTLIVPPGSSNAQILYFKNKQVTLNGCLKFSPPIKHIPALSNFLKDVSTENRPNDILLQYIVGLIFSCKISNPWLEMFFKEHGMKRHVCNRTICLRFLPSCMYDTQNFRFTYQIYKAVYAMAHSLHEMLLYMPRNTNISHYYSKNYKDIIKVMHLIFFFKKLIYSLV